MTWNDQFASQHGEDRWICDHWGELRLPDFGFFVEFGAGDGKYLSNTWWFEKSRGWHGLLLEPDPRNVITSRPRSRIERLAVADHAGRLTIGCPPDPYLSGALRTPDAKKEIVRAREMIEVDCAPLSDVLARHSVDGIDVISIDTEGNELECWRTLNLKRWRPRVAIIELTTWGLPDRSEEIIDAMGSDCYDLSHRTTHNGIFVDSRAK